jgi:Carboxypeptidase regulatory-like domain
MGKAEPALDAANTREGYRRAILLVSVLAWFALHASTGAGQTVGAMTGAINGNISDSTGAVLSGVTVVISSAALMGTRTTVTNAEGRYRFPVLAPGEYTLVFTLDGFKAVRHEGIVRGEQRRLGLAHHGPSREGHHRSDEYPSDVRGERSSRWRRSLQKPYRGRSLARSQRDIDGIAVFALAMDPNEPSVLTLRVRRARTRRFRAASHLGTRMRR